MNNWMLCTVMFTDQQPDGTFKRVKEQHLIAAGTFTDTELRAHKEIGEFIRGEFLVHSIVRFSVNEIISDDSAEYWYKTTVNETDLEGKLTKTVWIVLANSVREATERVRDTLADSVNEYEITGTVLTKIVEVHPVIELPVIK